VSFRRSVLGCVLACVAAGCSGTSGTVAGADSGSGASSASNGTAAGSTVSTSDVASSAALIVQPPATVAPAPVKTGADRGPCDVLTDRFTAFGSLLVDENLDAARTAIASVAQYTAEFERLAPKALSDEANAVATYYAALRDNNRGATFDEYVAGFSEGYTDEVARAGDRISEWSKSCDLDVYRLSPHAEEIAVCLAAGTSDDDVQRVAKRVNVPTGDGAQTDLIDGVALFGEDRAGFKIKLSLAITAQRRAEIIELLSAAPVERVLLGVDPEDGSHCA
jgi:hypothetical protein